MNVDNFPHKKVQNIGRFGYIFAILKGSNRPVNLVNAYTENGEEEIEGDFAATISKGVFILTGYSESRSQRVPLICKKWRKQERNKDADKFKKQLFKGIDMPEIDQFTDTEGMVWEYIKPSYNSALRDMIGSLKCSDKDGRQLLEIFLK